MNTADIWERYFSGDHPSVIAAGAKAAELMHVAGLSLIALGRFEEAETVLFASAHALPNPDWYSNAVVQFLEAGEFLRALKFGNVGLQIFPEHANLNFNTGNAVMAIPARLNGNVYPADAMRMFQQALATDPTHWESAMNLANHLRRIATNGDHSIALSYYGMALANVGDNLEASVRIRMNMAICHSDMNNIDVALRMLDELAASGDVISPEMDFNRATMRLKLGDYAEGWKLYERRWDCAMAENTKADFLKPRLTSLEEARDKRVLFCHEQGFGDSIQFVRYAPMLAEIADVTILVPEPLVRLFRCLGLPVVSTRDGLDYDFECPMLDAPRLFGTTLDTIPTAPYLTVPEGMYQAPPNPEKKLRVGVIWAGQNRPHNPELSAVDRKRSIAASHLQHLFMPGVEIISLQHGERADDEFFADEPTKVLTNENDFLDTAAIMKTLDLVITVDTAAAHLAGAIGVPVWIMSRTDGCWRWLRDRIDSPWYPSAKLYHEANLRSHGLYEVVKDVVHDLGLKLS